MSGVDLDRWTEIRGWFDDLVDLDPARRADRLEQLGRRDPDLRKAVEAMLGYDALAGERLRRMDFGAAQLLRGAGAAASTGAIDPLGLVGRTIAHFRILEPLASGGMGVVYRARDERLERIVAVKFAQPRNAVDTAVKERFLREARSAGGLDHPNLCSIYEAGESEDGHLFLAMPLYPGQTLGAKLASEAPLPWAEALEIAHQIADGLACAHAAGIVHRDLKPGNVMVLPDGTVKILDFGLAKVPELSQTGSGGLLGTAAYMSPEQIRGDSVDARADLWALGVVIYQMIAGRRPFNGDRDISIAHAVVNEEPQPLCGPHPDVPRGVERLILDLLQKDPARRYSSAEVVATDIRAIRRGETPLLRHRGRGGAAVWLRERTRRVKRTAVALAVVLAASTAVAAQWSVQPPERKPTASAKAYALFTRGYEYERVDGWTGESQRAAEALYRRAIEADPGFALAWARLANVHSNDQFHARTRSRAGLERMRREAEIALKLDPRLGEAHLVLGFYWRIREDYPRALAALTLAHRYAPADAEAATNLGEVYAALGRWDDALAWMRRGAQLDPRREGGLADNYVRHRRYDAALRSIERHLEFLPDDYYRMLVKGRVYLNWKGTADTLSVVLSRIPQDWDFAGLASEARVTVARLRRRPLDALAALPAARDGFLNYYTPVSLLRGRLYAQAGDTLRARAEYEVADSLLSDRVAARPDDGRLRMARAEALAALGRRDEAKAEITNGLARLPAERWQTGPGIRARAAAVYVQLSENGRAIDLLERLIRDPAAGYHASAPLLRVDPTWDPLRGDPRFERLVARSPD